MTVWLRETKCVITLTDRVQARPLVCLLSQGSFPSSACCCWLDFLEGQICHQRKAWRCNATSWRSSDTTIEFIERRQAIELQFNLNEGDPFEK